MHLWNHRILAKELGQDLITEKMGMYYFFISWVLITFGVYLYSSVGISRGWMFYFELIIISVITVYGCLLAFESNSGNEGKDFINRGICLSVPIGVRVILLSVIFVLFLYLTKDYIFTIDSFGGNPLRAFTIIRYTGFIGLNAYFWWMLVKGYKQIQQYKKSSNTNHIYDNKNVFVEY